MKTPVETMMEAYKCTSAVEYRNALKEIVQEITLLGLARADFFNRAAFYGGTALRMFHGLNRFSEDLDFSLLKSDDTFRIDKWFSAISDELGAYGFDLTVTRKDKKRESSVQSAFIKGGTLIQVLNITSINPPVFKFDRNEQIRIKVEIDTDPPAGATFEFKSRLVPIMYSARLYDLPSLFAGKLHALLCRSWKQRVKGRDFYDYVWYLQRNIPVNISHLQNRMVQSGHLKEKEDLDRSRLLEMLNVKFAKVNFSQVVEDILPFIKNTREVSTWNRELFSNASAEFLKIL